METTVQQEEHNDNSLNENSNLNIVAIPRGRFEGCFFNGLDLSELDDDSRKKSSTGTTSHSAQLLVLRQQEAAQQQMEQLEDERFIKMARNRSEQLMIQSSTNDPETKRKTSPGVLHARPPHSNTNATTAESASSGFLEIIGTKNNSGNCMTDGSFLQALIGGIHTTDDTPQFQRKNQRTNNKGWHSNNTNNNPKQQQRQQIKNNCSNNDKKNINHSKNHGGSKTTKKNSSSSNNKITAAKKRNKSKY